MDSGTPIYDNSKTCDHLFARILSRPDAASVLVAEVLHQRFKQWASYLGVFAPENVSLDTRLRYSESISQLVVQFLQIASRNLEHISKLDEVLKANNSAGEGWQRSVAEEVDHAPDSGASSPLAESLRAAKTAIDGLYRLGVAIRQSSSSTLNQRISNFAQEMDHVAIENMVFFRLKHDFFDKDQKESNSKSPLSLYRQLAISISFRYFGLLYRQSRQEKMEKNRESAPVQPQRKPEGNIPPPNPAQSKKNDSLNEPEKLASANAGMKQQPEKSEGGPTTVNTNSILKKYAATEKSFAASKSVLSAHIKDTKYPDLPKVDPQTREAKCQFCGRPIFEMDLKKKDWWQHHLDQDLKLYTCLSETCAEPPQLFVRFHEWSQHMDEHHSTNWIEEIHKPLGWCCDVEHDDLYFDDEDEYDQHVKEAHPEYEAEKAELKEWGELQRERPRYRCPICNCVPKEIARIFPWLCGGKLANPAAIGTEVEARVRAAKEEDARDKLLLHIGAHLKQLGLMSIKYFGDDADDDSMDGKRDSIPIDKDGKVLLVENSSDYFDPQFTGYMVPTEPRLLDEGVDWSDVKTLGTNHAPFRDDADDRSDPTAAAQIPPSTFEGHYAHSSLRPVPNYVPRPRLHQKIKEQLHDLKDNEVEDVRILVVWGLGGAGKSQLVLNYVREYRRDYTAVFWIEARSKESIERDYVQIYRLLSGRQINTGDEMVKVKDAVAAVKRWFHGREGRWLVVLDSADTIDDDQQTSYIDLDYFMPDAPGVHVVITSRSSTAKEMTTLDAVEVTEMEPSEARELFRRYAKLTENGLDMTREVDEIVRELGYLALAITLAGSYVSVTPRLSSDIGRYLPEYHQRLKELLRRQAKQHIPQYRESLLSTLGASFEAIENHNPCAARLLSLLAFLNIEDIFLGLFDGDGADVLASAPRRVTESSNATLLSNETWQSFLFSEQQWTVNEIESAFETLQSYSLIQWKSDQESYAMHKLVHACVQDRLETNRQRQLSSLALELMADAIAEDQIDPSHQLRLVPHVIASFDMFSSLHESRDELAMDRLSMIDEIGGFLFRIGRWPEAYRMQVFYFRKTEKMLGKEHPSTLGSMNNLALVLSSQGKYQEAERMHREALALRERVLGKEHPSTLTSMSNLAEVLSSQGKYEEAERIHRQALALCETVLGKEHPSTLTGMNSLLSMLSSQGKYEEAERMHREALALKERVLGKEHPDTLTSISNLAEVLSSQGKYEEAERIHRQALTLRETVLGKEHPDTLTSMNNLALMLSSQGKYEETERIHRRLLALRERVLGKEHPDTLTSVYCLAYLLHQKKRYEDAEGFYHRAYAGYRMTLGEQHQTTVACSRHYSSMLKKRKAGKI